MIFFLHSRRNGTRGGTRHKKTLRIKEASGSIKKKPAMSKSTDSAVDHVNGSDRSGSGLELALTVGRWSVKTRKIRSLRRKGMGWNDVDTDTEIR